MSSYRIPILAALLLLLAAPARAADTVTQTFSFTNPFAPGGPRPAGNMRVELRRSIWPGQLIANGVTDANGRVSLSIPNVPLPYTVFFRIYAETPNVIVNAETAAWLNTSTYFFDAPAVWLNGNDNENVVIPALSLNQTSSRHFNVAWVIDRGHDWVNAHRDPLETDEVGQLVVQLFNCTYDPITCPTFYDPNLRLLRLSTDFLPTRSFVFNDAHILHEYGHFVTDEISTFFIMPSAHNGCDAVIAPPAIMGPLPTAPLTGALTTVVTSRAHAWMEGFATWFALRVTESASLVNLDSGLAQRVEDAAGCPNIDSRNDDGELIRIQDTENGLQGLLWDVTDAASFGEFWDLVDATDADIFQIFDREQDMNPGYPDFDSFYDAWLRRGHDAKGLDQIMFMHGVEPELFAKKQARAAFDRGLPVLSLGGAGRAFYRTEDGGLTLLRQDSVGGAHVPVSITSSALSSAAVVPCSGCGLTQMSVFVRDEAGALARLVVTSFGTLAPTSPVGSLMTSSPTAFVTTTLFVERREGVVYRGANNRYFHVAHVTPAGGTSGWTTPATIGTLPFVSAPVAVQLVSGRVELFGLDANGWLWRSEKPVTSTTFGGWALIAFDLSSAPSAAERPDGRLELVARRRSDNQLVRSIQNAPGGTYGAWGPLTTSTTPVQSPATTSRGLTGLVSAFLVGAEGNMSVRVVRHGTGTFQDLPVRFGAQSQPVLVTDGEGRLLLYVTSSLGVRVARANDIDLFSSLTLVTGTEDALTF